MQADSLLGQLYGNTNEETIADTGEEPQAVTGEEDLGSSGISSTTEAQCTLDLDTLEFQTSN